MFISTRKFTTAILFAAGVASFAGSASAAPVNGMAIKNATPSNVESVQWRRGLGWGVGAGFLAGAIVGGMIAAPYYGYGPYYGPAYGYGPYYGPAYGYGPYYRGPYVAGPVYRVAPGYRSAVAYCMSRFRSYNPRTGTYLGYDGLRHRCP